MGPEEVDAVGSTAGNALYLLLYTEGIEFVAI